MIQLRLKIIFRALQTLNFDLTQNHDMIALGRWTGAEKGEGGV